MKSNLIIALFITISINFVTAQGGNNSWLEENLYNVKNINPKEENFEDLAFLIPLLKDKQIVMLGEESHSFATTFEAKTRLIKFLHQKLDFKVIAFEFDLYSMWEIEKLTANSEEQLLPIQKRIYPFWGRTTSTQELFSYVERTKATASPLKYIGFDCQIVPQFDLLGGMVRLLEQNNSVILEYENFEVFKSVFQKSYNSQMRNLSLENYALLSFFIDDILFEFEIKKSKDKETLVMLRTLENVKEEMYNQIVNKTTHGYQMGNLNPTDSIYGLIWDRRSLGVLNRRDKLMAENIRWIKEELYPEDKIIIWAHSEHTMYQRNEVKKIFPPDFPFHLRFTFGNSYKSMGSYVKDYFENLVYSIGFSTINGDIDYSTNRNAQYFSTVQPEEGSIEKQLSELNYDYPYLDFSSKTEELPKSIFKENMVSGFLDGTATIGNISKFFDGILFIKNAQPIKYLKEDED